MSTYTRRLLLPNAPVGLTGLEYAVYSDDGATVLVNRTGTGITDPLTSGNYEVSVANWSTEWSGVVRWTTGSGTVLQGLEDFPPDESVDGALYTRRIALAAAASGLLPGLEYAVYAEDGSTVLVVRSAAGAAEILSSGFYEASVFSWDPTWRGVIRWTTASGTVLQAAQDFRALPTNAELSLGVGVSQPSAGAV